MSWLLILTLQSVDPSGTPTDLTVLQVDVPNQQLCNQAENNALSLETDTLKVRATCFQVAN